MEKNGDNSWKILKGNPIPTSSFLPIHNAIKEINITTHFMNEKFTYIHHTSKNSDYIQTFVESMKKYSCLDYIVVSTSPLLDWSSLDMPTYKIMFYSDNEEDVAHIWTAVNNARIPGIVTEFSSPHTVDVRTVDSGKKKTMEFLCEHLHIDRKEVMALGDHESDMELILWAGVGAFMENGDAALKKDAPLLAPSNDACGVATMIEKYALK